MKRLMVIRNEAGYGNGIETERSRIPWRYFLSSNRLLFYHECDQGENTVSDMRVYFSEMKRCHTALELTNTANKRLQVGVRPTNRPIVVLLFLQDDWPSEIIQILLTVIVFF